MYINDLPNEVLFQILHETAKINEREGVTFTFGLSKPPMPAGQELKRPQRYVRGPVPPSLLRLDATSSLRRVCSKWHSWAQLYAFKDIYVRLWRGSERWCDLSLSRSKYHLYELIEYPRGEKVFRDPYLTLNRTAELFADAPAVASSVRRLYFDGLYVPETDATILSTIKLCDSLTSVSLPWTTLRHGSALDWNEVLGNHRAKPLQSLEFVSTNLSEKQLEAAVKATVQHPLRSGRVNFCNLKRLKLFGDSTFMPINDDDLKSIARTATGLEEFQITCMSTVTIEGVMAIVRSSQQTLRMLEHAPRSMDGFWHPHPGSTTDNEHLCELLTQCPRLEDLSISLPSMCAALFSNRNVRWRGDCQVRALHVCGHEGAHAERDRSAVAASLRRTLAAARALAQSQAWSILPVDLSIELFFADCIFEPHVSAVHGDFQIAETLSRGAWPAAKEISRKGPYGSTGLYEKDYEEMVFEMVDEKEFLRGVEAGWVAAG